ncbi:MAG: glycosyltransferase family 4 protein [Nevskia sp.]|nr:glycosyltransferase family 4 protein [Nevskia sp.]
MKYCFLDWQANNTFGWGIAGLNIFFQLANDPELRPLMGMPLAEPDVAMFDPLRVIRCLDWFRASNQFLQELNAGKRNLQQAGVVLVDAVGNDMKPLGQRSAARTVGRCVFEDTRTCEAREQARRYDALVCASSWNAGLLQASFDIPVTTIFEGTDPSLFHPGPRSGILDPTRFYIFSGGKVEFRKAQDLVLLAFAEFSRRHEDAVLVTAWHSPWPQRSAGFRGRLRAPLELAPSGRINVKKWVSDNGVPAAKVIEIGPVPNPVMPMILREMDCSLQPSRAEGGTNFQVKESMACGVPVIVADNSGVRDIIEDGNCIPLRRQGKVDQADGIGTDGWGESDVEEIVEALELLYTDSARRKQVGQEGARSMTAKDRSWARHARELKQFLLSL